jgi:phosphoesterase RecJ-like protein
VPEVHNLVSNLKKLIEDSSKILVTSHIAPDPDAVSSALLVGRTLSENYPNKEITTALEEEPLTDLRFLAGYDTLTFKNIKQLINDTNPDLLIVVDANTYNRISRSEAEEIRDYAQKHKGALKTVIIDHHEPDGREDVDLFINNKRPASAEEVYVICFELLKLKKPHGFAETTLLGIVSDTQRHKFDHPGYRETYRIVADLLDAGASIEKLESRLDRYTEAELKVICHLAANIVDSAMGYTYTFISDDFAKQWQDKNLPTADLRNGVEFFTDRIIRNFENNDWGFVIYPDSLSGKNYWGVSFRSISGAKDVSAIARKLSGGGHKPAAGAKIKAQNTAQAIEKVKEAISQS